MKWSPSSHAYLDAAPDGIFVATAEGRIEYASPRGVGLFGQASQHEVVGHSLRDFVEREDFARVVELLRDAGRGPAEVRLRRPGEVVVWAEASADRVPGQDGQLVLVVRDVSRRKRVEDELVRAKRAAEESAARLARALRDLEQAAATDKLTGLFNRGHFEQVMAVEQARNRRYGHLCSLIVLDVDHFKAVNDQFGHDAGDKVLVAIAGAVARAVRVSDTACRWGGEEFAILLPGVGAAAAARMADRIREAVAEEQCPGVPVRVTVSAGVAQLDTRETGAEGFKRADLALYRAKEGGRNRVELSVGACDAAERRVIQLVWDPGHDSGDERLDGQHRHLFALGNALLDDAMSGGDAAAIRARFSALLAHAMAHFDDEEALLERICYADLRQHAALHRALVQEAQRLERRLEAGELALQELVSFLVVRVVRDHIVGADTRFFQELAAAQSERGMARSRLVSR
jgi:diguanylate cyclase (GGDEF)-like protein/hemerythrin-like metal-binding protein/PAS domain S-box-containing protein